MINAVIMSAVCTRRSCRPKKFVNDALVANVIGANVFTDKIIKKCRLAVKGKK